MRTVSLPRNTVQQASVAAKSVLLEAFEHTMRLPVAEPIAHGARMRIENGCYGGSVRVLLRAQRILQKLLTSKIRHFQILLLQKYVASLKLLRMRRSILNLWARR